MPKRAFAIVSHVDEGSPAHKAGIRAGFAISSVDGNQVADILDWIWHTDAMEIAIAGKDCDGADFDVVLHRDIEDDGTFSDWGMEFKTPLFDGMRKCKNNCLFCFMDQLPNDVRKALVTRDDDFRMSFLDGTFITLTNLDDADIDRIAEQGISPLRVSLHAVSEDVRERLIGKNAKRGMDAFERLLDRGVEFDAQIVLMPGINDAEELDRTLEWAYSKDGILNVAIVPVGYTRHQRAICKSYEDPKDALGVLEQIAPFQRRAMSDLGRAWAYAADELYLAAYGSDVLDHLEDEVFYDGYPMFEDGVGIVRSSVDSFREAESSGMHGRLRDLALSEGIAFHLVCGRAMEGYFPQLLEKSELAGIIRPLFVDNHYFGGNVNVTGLLTGEDVISSISEEAQSFETGDDAPRHVILLPSAMFNSDGLTLDDMPAEQIADATGLEVIVASSNPLDCIDDVLNFIGDH